MDVPHDPHDQAWYHRLLTPEWRWVIPIVALVLLFTVLGTWREMIFTRNATQMRDWLSQQQYEIITQQQQILTNQGRIMANQQRIIASHEEIQTLLRRLVQQPNAGP